MCLQAETIPRFLAEYVSTTCAERCCRIRFSYLCRETLPNKFQLLVQRDAAEYVSTTSAERRCRIRFNYLCRETLPNKFQLPVQIDAAEYVSTTCVERRCRAMTKRVCLFARYELMWNIRRRNEWFMAGRVVARGVAAQRGGFSSGVFAQSQGRYR